MFLRLAAVLLVTLVGVLLIACGGDGDDEASSAPTVSADDEGSGNEGGGQVLEVDIVDFGYDPVMLNGEADAEATLNLTNNGDLPHTFTIDGVMDSREVAPGESRSIMFPPTGAGTYTFFCTVHGAATMSGELTLN